MMEYSYPGAVYIFENTEAKRVKVGVTGNHSSYVDGRLRDVNYKWDKIKATCQICGGRRIIDNLEGLFPKHAGCPGGNELPLENDVTLAESHLKYLKIQQSELSGSEKGSVTRMINTLEKRIEKYRDHKPPVGEWKSRVIFYTECSGEAESLAHEILADHLDKSALFGEVFCCSVLEATEAVETALSQLRLLDSARKELINEQMSESTMTTKEYIESLREKRGYYSICPKCGYDLIVRTAKNGPTAGSKFLGCEKYPKCRFTTNLKPSAPAD
jgi:hypothetical protein